VHVQVVDGGTMGSRRHLNIRSKSANLPAITERDWQDIDFGIEMGVDFYALSFVRDADCIYELQAYLKRHGSHAKARALPAAAASCRAPALTAKDCLVLLEADTRAKLSSLTSKR
jgi:pyruvate kinase